MRALAWTFASERRFRARPAARAARLPAVRPRRSVTRLPGLQAWTQTRDLKPVARRRSASGGHRDDRAGGDPRRGSATLWRTAPTRSPPTSRCRGATPSAEERATVELFVERVADYGAGVHVVAPASCRTRWSGVPEARCDELAVPADLRAMASRDVEVVHDAGLRPRSSRRSARALTGCALGIAETGTIVLDGGRGRADAH